MRALMTVVSFLSIIQPERKGKKSFDREREKKKDKEKKAEKKDHHSFALGIALFFSISLITRWPSSVVASITPSSKLNMPP